MRKTVASAVLVAMATLGAVPALPVISSIAPSAASATESPLTIEVFPGTGGDYVVIKLGKQVVWAGWVPH
jgi:hypothetical protein